MNETTGYNSAFANGEVYYNAKDSFVVKVAPFV